MHIGTVKWFNSTKGYGFVEPNDKSRDVFTHTHTPTYEQTSGLKN